MAKQKKPAAKPALPPEKKEKKKAPKTAVLRSPPPVPEPPGNPAAASLAETDLVALKVAASKPAVVNITFTSGRGQATAIQFRNGLIINTQSVASSSDVHFSDVQTGDAISVNGVCTGTAAIAIDIATDPVTPSQFTAGSIHIGYDIV